MKKKNLILFILLFILILGTITIISIFKNSKEPIYDETLESSNSNIQNNSNFSNTLENIVTEVTSNTIENIIVENVIEENTVIDNTITEVITSTTEEGNTKPNTENNTPTKTPSTTPPSTVTSTTKPNETKEETKIDTKVDIEETSKSETVINKEQNNTSTEKSEEPIEKEDTTTPVGNPELAYTTYRVTNTTIIPEIISILNSEIAKDKELVDFGTKAVSTTKTNAYNNTNYFTYLFVKDITKGKVAGNYKSFPERVRNTVGAFGTYYVYAEDEYTYDGRGLNPKWSQTLVWIYVNF